MVRLYKERRQQIFGNALENGFISTVTSELKSKSEQAYLETFQVSVSVTGLWECPPQISLFYIASVRHKVIESVFSINSACLNKNSEFSCYIVWLVVMSWLACI